MHWRIFYSSTVLCWLLLTGCGGRAADEIGAQDEPVAGAARSAETVATADQPQSAELRRMEEAVARRVNAVRQQHDKAPLEANEKLAEVARAYSRRMAQEGFFSHYDPSGKTVLNRVQTANLPPMHVVAENLFKNVNAPDPIDGALRTWMNSRKHRQNILNGGLTQTGVGIWRQGNSTLITQIFARPKSANSE